MKKEKPTTKLCKHCKTEIPYDAKVCPNCRKKQKGGKLKWILIIAVVAVIALLIYGSGNSYKLSEDASNMSEKDYKTACNEIEYSELARSANKYKGSKVKFEGEIQQIVYDSENGESEYLIHVTKDDLGLWSDSIYVYYANKSDSKFIEDDIVAIYGEASGEESYTSVLGQNITIPAVTAAYMELEK